MSLCAPYDLQEDFNPLNPNISPSFPRYFVALTVISEDDYLSSVISDSNLSLILKANPVM
jgi:hypothetical protein